MLILGIETSCDETAASVIKAKEDKIKVLSSIVSSQIKLHQKYGGVVPELAAREHVLNILPVINKALEQAGLSCENAKKKISAIAVTQGPGLITSLLAGVETAKTLSYVWDIPLIGVNHIKGHIYANFLDNVQCSMFNVQFPALILTVSGGHTLLVLMKDHGKYKVVGETLDDAAGEAFDKAAKMMELGYPGGPIISKLAKEFKKKSKITLPRPMIYSKDYNFSFSGLKTALLYKLKKDQNWKKNIPEYSCEFQQAVIDCLVHKTIKAALKFKTKTIMLTGGVSANQELRKQLKIAIKKQAPFAQIQIPALDFCTDNAAMIAAAGYFQAVKKDFTSWQKLKADCNLSL